MGYKARIIEGTNTEGEYKVRYNLDGVIQILSPSNIRKTYKEAQGVTRHYPKCCVKAFCQACQARKGRYFPNTVKLAQRLIEYATGLDGFVPCEPCAGKVVEA